MLSHHLSTSEVLSKIAFAHISWFTDIGQEINAKILILNCKLHKSGLSLKSHFSHISFPSHQ